jgi:hypothetical protein
MGLFKRKKPTKDDNATGPLCSNCQSTNTRVIDSGSGTIKTWRGQRYLAFRCNECGYESYINANTKASNSSSFGNQDEIDEAELRAAEEELKKEIDKNGDHTFG